MEDNIFSQIILQTCLYISNDRSLYLSRFVGEPDVYFGQSEIWEPFMTQSHEEHCPICNWWKSKCVLDRDRCEIKNGPRKLCFETNKLENK
jgi:hypothetical protein